LPNWPVFAMLTRSIWKTRSKKIFCSFSKGMGTSIHTKKPKASAGRNTFSGKTRIQRAGIGGR
jgi:hypothetical protein